VAVAGATFETSVLVNCPFDSDYLLPIRAMLFTLVRCGLTPRIATERADSGEVRYRKIVELQKACKYSIHDLSRLDRGGKRKLARYNMPFELGLEFGLRESGVRPWCDKRCHSGLPYGTPLWKDFNFFFAALDADLRAGALVDVDLAGMTAVDYLRHVTEYCASR
jgi:hypothetical protein